MVCERKRRKRRHSRRGIKKDKHRRNRGLLKERVLTMESWKGLKREKDKIKGGKCGRQ